MTCVFLEYLFGGHFSDGHCESGIHKVNYLPAPDKVDKGNNHKPDK